MATQEIPLSLAAERDKQHFRLLELPAELLDTILATESPILELKSFSTESGAESDSGNAVLCTIDKTYRIRQKNSSNSVYIVHPSEHAATPGVLAVAQCYSTLELSKNSPSQSTEFLRHIIPLYSSTGVIAAGGVSTVREAFNAIPLSERECQAALIELAITTHPQTGGLIRPSAQTKIDVWRAILETALASNIPITEPLSEDVARKLTGQLSETESAIAEAVLKATGILQTGGTSSFAPQQSVRWLGTNLLEVEALHAAVPAKDFVGKWRDLLPESWRAEADVTLLNHVAIIADGGRSIKCDESKFTSDSSASTSGPATGRAADGRKLKWHERFRPSNR